MMRAALAAGLVAGVLGAMVPPAGRAMTPQAANLADDLAAASAPNDAPAMTVVPDHGSATESITLTVHFPYVSDRPNGVCPGGSNPPAVLDWDGVRMQTLDMHGECDLATTVTPLAGHTGPGVHRIDATLTLPDVSVLTAIGLYTVDAVPASTPASATPSAPSGPASGGRGLKYVAGIAAVLALIAIAVVARRRRPA